MTNPTIKERSRTIFRRAVAGFWPGAVRISRHEGLAGLLMAAGFALLLNVWLMTSWIWTDWAMSTVSWSLGLAAATTWLLGWLDAQRVQRRWAEMQQQDPHLDLFLAARSEYLRGDWESAQSRLEDLLRVHPQDVEARLLLATLMRHRGEVDLGREQLRQLQRWREASRWNQEIRREWDLLERSPGTIEERQVQMPGAPHVERSGSVLDDEAKQVA